MNLLYKAGRLNDYLADREEQAQKRFERICRADEKGAEDYRTVKGRKLDGMGSENEQYTGVCEEDCG